MRRSLALLVLCLLAVSTPLFAQSPATTGAIEGTVVDAQGGAVPGVTVTVKTIVQGPDGDELSINGQKGISNNVSVDGADFNNPFFGEQRGGQRPPFTFNLDAVKELVVVADGANAEFGRSMSGFVNVVTKSGTNETAGTAHVTYKNDSLSSQPKNPDGTT